MVQLRHTEMLCLSSQLQAFYGFCNKRFGGDGNVIKDDTISTDLFLRCHVVGILVGIGLMGHLTNSD